MIKWIKSIFSWHEVGTKGAWSYYENEITGRRKVSKKYIGHSPIDHDWLKGAEWKRENYAIETCPCCFGPR